MTFIIELPKSTTSIILDYPLRDVPPSIESKLIYCSYKMVVEVEVNKAFDLAFKVKITNMGFYRK